MTLTIKAVFTTTHMYSRRPTVINDRELIRLHCIIHDESLSTEVVLSFNPTALQHSNTHALRRDTTCIPSGTSQSSEVGPEILATLQQQRRLQGKRERDMF